MKINNYSILWPVFALAFWTLSVMGWVAVARIRAGMKGQIRNRDFALGEAPTVPQWVQLANRNYMNLLEVPILFYVVCLVIYVTAMPGQTAIALAWAFVATRVAHSLIHLSYNKISHRFFAFALSNLVLIGMWVLALMTLLKPYPLSVS
jgi:hypothetical protein